MRIRPLLSFTLLLLALAVSQIEAASSPGVILTFESADGKQADAREARLVALSVPQNSPPTSFITPGPFHATFHGALNLPIRDQYAFRAAGRGKFELLINGDSVLKGSGEDLSTATSVLVKLKKGANDLVLRYTSPPSGDAMIRLSWAPKNRAFDPIPPTVLTHEDDPSLQGCAELREGRALFAGRRCFRCHTPPQNGQMQELSIDAPNLDTVGSRLNPQWIARWIVNPKALRSDATMPRVFARDEMRQAAESVAADIAAYLASRTDAKAQATDAIDASEANVIGGERLFLSLGCIACHTAPPAQDEGARTTLQYVSAKFKPGALRDYLKKPEAHYAWTRMPNFRLSDDEAMKLAAFLLRSAPADALGAVDLTSADAERGKTFFELTGCMKCHSPEIESRSRAKPVAELIKGDWSAGCMAADSDKRGNAPDFGLTEPQLTALRRFAKTDWTSLNIDSPVEFAERQIRSVNCLACHTRDGEQDTWSKLGPQIASLQQDLPPEPETKTEQIRPLLTWTGEKLETDWMGTFIAGKIDYKPRPWLKARMPAFASRATLLAQGLTLEHGLPLTGSPEQPVDPAFTAIGRKLAGRNGGLSCNQCHAINQSPAFVPFDSPSLNFMYVHERVRKDYFQRWTRNPSRYMPGTKMPSYADADGKTALKDILDGDANQQFEAIWQYLRAGRDIQAPE
jgi:mono/diheme cytochrome c family protein